MPRRTRGNQNKAKGQKEQNSATQMHPNRRNNKRKRNRYGRPYDDQVLDFDLSKLHATQARFPVLDHGRILGVDFGERRVGLAMSDPTGRIAQGLDTFETKTIEDTLVAVVSLVAKHDINRIVVGLPINMDGTEGDMTKRVHEFVKKIEDRVLCDVITWDERLTSTAAERTMVEIGRAQKGHKVEIDRISATIILQGYLESIR